MTSANQIKQFIANAIDRKLSSNTTVAYGKVNDRLAKDVLDASGGKIKITDYLELIPDNLQHAYEQHHTAKQAGDIDLERSDFENIPEYLDSYTEIVYAIEYASGKVGVCVSKRLSNGRILLIETVSKSRGALQFKNAIGVSEDKYQTDYVSVYKKRAGTNTRGCDSSNNSLHDGSNSKNSIRNEESEVKKKYSFAGRGAVTADRSALQQAEQMQEQGADNETICLQIGWFQGMDGKWRFEIDDSQMEISKTISNYMRLGDLMQHEKLYAAYPDLADIDVVFQSLDAGVSGSYHPQFDRIDLSYKLKNDPIGLKDALVHEIQHAIQQREGFTKGATAESWERKKKAGFDSRRAADIRKAQETERELRRIQKEEPEFYRDMVELDAMTPDLPRGKINWDTLEKIEDDPVEWQRYDARREELEAKYGDTKVWDMNDLR